MRTVKILNTILWIAIVFQLFWFYFIGNDLIAIMPSYIYRFVLLGFLIAFIVIYVDLFKKQQYAYKLLVLSVLGLILSAVLLLRKDYIEKLDWHLREGTRNRIVQDIKNGKIDTSSYFVKVNNIPPVSFYGNRIAFRRYHDGTIFVGFTTRKNSGLMADSREGGYVYTDNPKVIAKIEADVQWAIQQGFPDYNFKIKENWYKVNLFYDSMNID